MYYKRAKLITNIFMIGCILLSMWVFISCIVLPFHPLTIYNYNPDQDIICPDQTATITYESSLLNSFGSVNDIELYSTWIKDPSQSTQNTKIQEMGPSMGSTTIYLPQHSRDVETSPIGRTPPYQAGKWYLQTTYLVKGSVLGLPRTDTLITISDKPIQVLPNSDSQCKEESY